MDAKLKVLLAAILALSSCATPRDFIAPTNATGKVAFEKALSDCISSTAISVNQSDTLTNSAQGAAVGAVAGLGGASIIPAVFGGGLIWPATGLAIATGALTGATLSGSLSTSKIELRDAKILGCLGAKGYKFEEITR
jgi:hypothetical protein